MPRTKHRDIADNFIFDDTVTTADLQNGSVTSTKLAEGAIDSAGKIGDNAITTAKIADNNITTAKILAGNITSSKLAEGIIDSAGKLGDNVVTSAKILDGSISSTKIAASAIDSAGLLGDGIITTAKISNDAVTGDKLANSITIADSLTITGSTSFAEVIEKVTIDVSTTGTIDFDSLTQGVTFFNTDQTANRTINFRGDVSTTLDSIMAVGESMTFAILMKQGGTAYYLNTYQIDGVGVTPEWFGGTAPSGGNTNSIDVYQFTIIKTASATYTVLGVQSQYA